MNAKTLSVLEFGRVRERLAAHTSFSASRELALELTPAGDYRQALARQQLSLEASRLLALKPNESIGGARDVRDHVNQARLGGVLDASALLDVRATLASARTLRGTITRLGERFPVLSALAGQMLEAPKVESEIARCISVRAEVLDAASPLLRRVRQEAAAAHERLISRIGEMLNSSHVRLALQEPLVTLRNGRYVIPVKAEMRGDVRGIVHDVSASGATVFVEPLDVVELGNAWRELQVEEEKEVERVLRRLSALVGAHAGIIATDVDLLARLDLALAAARFGAAAHCDFPELAERAPGTQAPLVLRNARHLLLTGRVVPIDVEVGGEWRELVITGPNTGGKTVALKTVGLLTLMAQSGLPIPAAPESRIPVYDAVFADIGDEQSIEQSLSTFSSHMANIIRMLADAGPDSLVLLDELGAGTDPVEGSALARAVLLELLERGSTVVATTHHSELKAFAHTTPGIMNASVEFDPETLAPTFRLALGLPGRSNALAIAARLGLSAETITRARSFLSPQEAALDDLLRQLQRQREEAEAQRQAARAQRTETEQTQRELEQRLAAIEEERQAAVESARVEALSELEQVRLRLRGLANRLEPAPAEERAIAEAKEEVKALRGQIRRWRSRTVRSRPAAELDLRPGAVVLVRGLGVAGEILAPPNAEGEVELRVGALRARVPATQLEPATRRIAAPAPQPAALPAIPAVPLELHLRGMRADEVLPKLERYLDEAFRAGIPSVRIVHGKGTGTLRQIVRELLSAHPLVRSHHLAEPYAGGEGVTVAEMAL